MEDYFTFTKLIGVRDANLSPYRDARVARYKSVKKMMDLLQVATKTMPPVPVQVFSLDRYDPQWDDLMPFPTVDYRRYLKLGVNIATVLFFYAYNFNIFSQSIRFRNWRNLFPLFIAAFTGFGYYKYRTQVLKINLFDEYCYLRSQQLVQQNEFILKSPSVQRYIWWKADLEETLKKIYRQANDNAPSDFKDSELILQDFINRYVNPQDKSPMGRFTSLI